MWISFLAKYAHTYKEFGLCLYPIPELVKHTEHTVRWSTHSPEQWAATVGSSEGLGALLNGTSAVDVGMGEQCSNTSPAHIFPTESGIELATLRFQGRL